MQTKKLHLQDLREAGLRFPEIAFWVKYNRARQGALRAGDIAPDVPLCRAQDGRETTLLALQTMSVLGEVSKPCVVIAGSLS